MSVSSSESMAGPSRRSSSTRSQRRRRTSASIGSAALFSALPALEERSLVTDHPIDEEQATVQLPEDEFSTADVSLTSSTGPLDNNYINIRRRSSLIDPFEEDDGPSVSWAAYFASMLLGAGSNISYFLMVYSTDFLTHFFTDYHPMFYLPVCLGLSLLLGNIGTVFFPVRHVRRLAAAVYTIAAIIAAAVPLMLYLTFYCNLLTRLQGLVLICACYLIFGLLQSYGAGHLYAFLGNLSSKTLQAGQSGTIWGSLYVYVPHVVAKALLHGNGDDNMLIACIIDYACVVTLLLCCGIVSSLFLPHSFSLHVASTAASETASLVDERPSSRTGNHRDSSTATTPLLLDGTLTASKVAKGYKTVPRPHGRQHKPLAVAWRRLRTAFVDDWPPLTVMFVYLVLVSVVYPGMYSVLHGSDDGWFVVILLGAFGVGDAIGQSLPAWKMLFNRRFLWVAILALVILCFPLLMGFQNKLAPSVFHNDYLDYTVGALMGFLTGHVVCCSIIIAVDDSTNHATASVLAAIMLQCGILVGSIIGVVFDVTVLPADSGT